MASKTYNYACFPISFNHLFNAKKFTLPLKMQPSNYNYPSLIINIPSDAVVNFSLFNFPLSIKSATFAPGFGSYTPELNHTRREVAANASRHFVPSKHELTNLSEFDTLFHPATQTCLSF